MTVINWTSKCFALFMAYKSVHRRWKSCSLKRMYCLVEDRWTSSIMYKYCFSGDWKILQEIYSWNLEQESLLRTTTSGGKYSSYRFIVIMFFPSTEMFIVIMLFSSTEMFISWIQWLRHWKQSWHLPRTKIWGDNLEILVYRPHVRNKRSKFVHLYSTTQWSWKIIDFHYDNSSISRNCRAVVQYSEATKNLPTSYHYPETLD